MNTSVTNLVHHNAITDNQITVHDKTVKSVDQFSKLLTNQVDKFGETLARATKNSIKSIASTSNTTITAKLVDIHKT